MKKEQKPNVIFVMLNDLQLTEQNIKDLLNLLHDKEVAEGKTKSMPLQIGGAVVSLSNDIFESMKKEAEEQPVVEIRSKGVTPVQKKEQPDFSKYNLKDVKINQKISYKNRKGKTSNRILELTLTVLDQEQIITKMIKFLNNQGRNFINKEYCKVTGAAKHLCGEDFYTQWIDKEVALKNRMTLREDYHKHWSNEKLDEYIEDFNFKKDLNETEREIKAALSSYRKEVSNNIDASLKDHTSPCEEQFEKLWNIAKEEIKNQKK